MADGGVTTIDLWGRFRADDYLSREPLQGIDASSNRTQCAYVVNTRMLYNIGRQSRDRADHCQI